MWSRAFCHKLAKALLFKYIVVVVVVVVFQSFEILYSSFFGGMTLISNNAEVSLGCQQTYKHNDNLLFLPLALQPAVGFGLSNNTSPFVPIYHQLSPSSHSQHLKISFHFFSLSFPGSSSSYRPFQFLSEDLFGHPILLHSLQVTQPAYPLLLYLFYYIFSFIQLF